MDGLVAETSSVVQHLGFSHGAIGTADQPVISQQVMGTTAHTWPPASVQAVEGKTFNYT